MLFRMCVCVSGGRSLAAVLPQSPRFPPDAVAPSDAMYTVDAGNKATLATTVKTVRVCVVVPLVCCMYVRMRFSVRQGGMRCASALMDVGLSLSLLCSPRACTPSSPPLWSVSKTSQWTL